MALRLTNTFAEKCFTPLEIYCFKQTFRSLAEEQSGLKYWSEPTLLKFLEIPDALGAGPVVYQLCSYLGAFPFPSHAPAILTGEALLRVVCLMTGRHMKVLRSGKEGWRREIWRGCAVFDREASKTATEATVQPVEPEDAETTQHAANGEEHHGATGGSSSQGFAVDESKNDEPQGEDDEDELAFHTFELMDALEVFKESEKVDVHHAIVPSDNFLKLLELLLLIAPLGPQENVSIYGSMLDDRRLEDLRLTASCILDAFGVEQTPGIRFKSYDKVVSATLPYLFDSLGPLFERFLFPKDFDLSKRKDSTTEQPATTPKDEPTAPPKDPQEPVEIPAPEPLLPVQGDILDLNLFSQLSFIFSGPAIFHRLHPLYLGHNHGYSMGSFEKSVFKWQAPSILLIAGTLISPGTKQSHARTFLEDIPHRRLSSSVSSPILESALKDMKLNEHRIIYGAYVPTPWKATHKTTFGNDKTALFQLSPVHDVFPASSLSQHYAYFNKPPTTYPGLGFGSPLPNYSSSTSSMPRRSSITYSASDSAYGGTSYNSSFGSGSFSGSGSPGLTRRSSLVGDEQVPLGPVSLHIDDALEFAVFTHLASGGGSFHTSKLPKEARPGAVNGNWQDRFEIEAIEVWGVGGKNEAEEQRKAWLFEEREAERRRRVNLGTGDVDADRELLKMAGLIRDESRSGGSV